MIEFGGVHYYIDLEALDKVTSVNNIDNGEAIVTEQKIIKDNNDKVIGFEEKKTFTLKVKEIEVVKYDIVRMMIEVLIDYNEQSGEALDDSLGIDRALQKTPLSYKVAFNTLYNCGVLKEKE